MNPGAGASPAEGEGLEREPQDGGVSRGTSKERELSTGPGSRPGGWRSAGRGARQDRLQLPERPGKRRSRKFQSRTRTPRTPKGLKLSAASSRTWSCPDRRERCPKGLGVIGQRRRPGGASLVAIPAPLPLVKECVAGRDRGAGRFKERTRTGGGWRCAPGRGAAGAPASRSRDKGGRQRLIEDSAAEGRHSSETARIGSVKRAVASSSWPTGRTRTHELDRTCGGKPVDGRRRPLPTASPGLAAVANRGGGCVRAGFVLDKV